MEAKSDRLFLPLCALGAGLMAEIDAYRFATQAASRAETIRQLVGLALDDPPLPKKHISVVRQLHSNPSQRDAIYFDVERFQRKIEEQRSARVHMSISSNELARIDNYQFAARITTRTKAVKYLLRVMFELQDEVLWAQHLLNLHLAQQLLHPEVEEIMA